MGMKKIMMIDMNYNFTIISPISLILFIYIFPELKSQIELSKAERGGAVEKQWCLGSPSEERTNTDM